MVEVWCHLSPRDKVQCGRVMLYGLIDHILLHAEGYVFCQPAISFLHFSFCMLFVLCHMYVYFEVKMQRNLYFVQFAVFIDVQCHVIALNVRFS